MLYVLKFVLYVNCKSNDTDVIKIFCRRRGILAFLAIILKVLTLAEYWFYRSRYFDDMFFENLYRLVSYDF